MRPLIPQEHEWVDFCYKDYDPIPVCRHCRISRAYMEHGLASTICTGEFQAMEKNRTLLLRMVNLGRLPETLRVFAETDDWVLKPVYCDYRLRHADWGEIDPLLQDSFKEVFLRHFDPFHTGPTAYLPSVEVVPLRKSVICEAMLSMGEVWGLKSPLARELPAAVVGYQIWGGKSSLVLFEKYNALEDTKVLPESPAPTS